MKKFFLVAFLFTNFSLANEGGLVNGVEQQKIKIYSRIESLMGTSKKFVFWREALFENEAHIEPQNEETASVLSSLDPNSGQTCEVRMVTSILPRDIVIYKIYEIISCKVDSQVKPPRY